MKFDYSPQLEGIWIMYLRKSRQDNPDETVEEVLAKHETMLQEYAEREFGHRIPEENIYREVVSGESIDERVEIKKVLARLEDTTVAGVLVVEPSRLSRGDLSDCARIIDNFRFTKSLVATPMMVYNLESKMERKFFQDELLRGNDYLEYTKEILFRGRVAAVKRGCFISSTPPFGYDRVKLGRDWTLEANDDADTVRMIYDMYTNEGLTPGGIARKLNAMGVKSPRDGKWTRPTVGDILKNVHYIGKVKYNEVRTTIAVEHGERVKKHLRQPDDEIIIAEGKQAAIVPLEVFEQAQERLKNAPRVKHRQDLVNLFAGVLRCQKCGLSMTFQKREKQSDRYICPQHPPCYKMAKAAELHTLILETLEGSELPKLQHKLKNGDGDSLAIQKRRLEKLNKQMEEYRAQEEKQYELLETGKYTQDLFDRRNAALRQKMEECEKEIHLAREALPKSMDYAEVIARLEDAIAAIKDETMPMKVRNRKIRAVVKTIHYSAVDLGRNKTAMTLGVHLKL